MARMISMKDAVNEALDQEMTRDPTVIMMGEDIVGGAGAQGEDDAWGGVLGVSKGLYARHPNQMIDTPLSESAYVGAAIGAATAGLRPVAELMFVDFIGVCLDQVFNQAAKFRYMFGGKAETPVVIRAMCGAGFRAAAQHSQMLTPWFVHVPGLKVVCPSNAYDCKGLLIQAIRDNDPVIFLEHKNLYGSTADVPEEPYAIPFGEANIVRIAGGLAAWYSQYAIVIGFPLGLILYLLLMKAFVLSRYPQIEMDQPSGDAFLATSVGVSWTYDEGKGFSRRSLAETSASGARREDL